MFVLMLCCCFCYVLFPRINHVFFVLFCFLCFFSFSVVVVLFMFVFPRFVSVTIFVCFCDAWRAYNCSTLRKHSITFQRFTTFRFFAAPNNKQNIQTKQANTKQGINHIKKRQTKGNKKKQEHQQTKRYNNKQQQT